MKKILLVVITLAMCSPVFGAEIEDLRKAAGQGNVGAQFDLGIMYYGGEGVTRDFKEAAKWFLKAAEQGNAAAQFNLGNMYSQGQGVTKDDEEAAKWIRKASEQWTAEGQFNLGNRYRLGQGVAQDFVQASMWFNLACSSGHAQAREALDDVAKKMTPAQIDESRRLAREKAAEIEKGKASEGK